MKRDRGLKKYFSFEANSRLEMDLSIVGLMLLCIAIVSAVQMLNTRMWYYAIPCLMASFFFIVIARALINRYKKSL